MHDMWCVELQAWFSGPLVHKYTTSLDIHRTYKRRLAPLLLVPCASLYSQSQNTLKTNLQLNRNAFCTCLLHLFLKLISTGLGWPTV